MKKFIKMIALSLSLITVASFTFVACKDDEPLEPPMKEEEEVKVGDGYFVENSKTDYVIVIPKEDNGKYMTAASELAYFWNMTDFPVVLYFPPKLLPETPYRF